MGYQLQCYVQYRHTDSLEHDNIEISYKQQLLGKARLFYVSIMHEEKITMTTIIVLQTWTFDTLHQVIT